MSHVRLLTHIVISTRHREMVIGVDHAASLYRYMGGLMNNQGCELIAINGIPNHIHMLIDLNPQMALASLMRELKRSTSKWLKNSGRFPMFEGWSEGYFACSISSIHIEVVKQYIDSQRTHHADKRYEEEYERLILKNGLTLYKFPD